MKQKIRLARIIVLVGFLTLVAPFLLSPSHVQAAVQERLDALSAANNAASSPNCDGEIVAGICVPETGLPDTPIEDILLSFMSWLFGIFGFLAIITFIIAGIQYFMAAGNPETAKKAKQHMLYSIIGILVALSGFIVILAISEFLSGSFYF